MKRLALILSLLCSANALANDVEGKARVYPIGTVLSAVALNAAEATRTASVELKTKGRLGYDIAIFDVAHTNDSGALTITMTCYRDRTGGTALTSILQDCSVSSGTCTSSDAVWSKAVTASKTWPWRVDITAITGAVNCVFAAAGAGASDTITVTADLSTK